MEIITGHDYEDSLYIVVAKVTEKILRNEPIEIVYNESYDCQYLLDVIAEICKYYNYNTKKVVIHVKDKTLHDANFTIIHDVKQISLQTFNRNIPYVMHAGIDKDYGLFLSRPNSVRMEAYKCHIDTYLNGLTSFNAQDYPPSKIWDFVNDYPYKWYDYWKNLPYSDINDLLPTPITPPLNSLGWEGVYKRIPVEIVCETNLKPNSFAITEKTARPFYYYRIPLIVGPLNYCKNLEKIGFDLFTDVIDMAYDNLEYQMRVNKIFQELQRLHKKYNWIDLLTNLKSRLEHNHKLLVEMAKNV